MMKFNQGIGNKIGRIGLFLLLFVVGGGVGLVGAYVCLVYGEGGVKALAVFALLWVSVWWYFTATLFNEMAAVTLMDEGIYVRILFKQRFWRWDDIIQAGVLWRQGKYSYYNDFVLLRQGGTPRKYQDKTFVARNEFKLIHLPATEEVRQFVIEHYGLLNFDLSDGRDENSIVVD